MERITLKNYFPTVNMDVYTSIEVTYTYSTGKLQVDEIFIGNTVLNPDIFSDKFIRVLMAGILYKVNSNEE